MALLVTNTRTSQSFASAAKLLLCSALPSCSSCCSSCYTPLHSFLNQQPAEMMRAKQSLGGHGDLHSRRAAAATVAVGQPIN
jgi:hypothetical protein